MYVIHFYGIIIGKNNTGRSLFSDTSLLNFASPCRMPVVSRLASCWAAVVLVWRWPVRFASKGSPRHQMERSFSSKVSRPKRVFTVLLLAQQESIWKPVD